MTGGAVEGAESSQPRLFLGRFDSADEAEGPKNTKDHLWSSRSPTPAQTRRIAALLSAHQAAWLGPLADVASRGSVVFRHGLLRELGLKKAFAARARTLVGCPQWATVERLDITMWDDAPALLLLGDPTLRALRVVDGLLSISQFAQLGVLPWHTLSLRFLSARPEVHALCQVANLPALRHLRFTARSLAEPVLDPVWRCPLVQQLHGLHVQCSRMRDVISLWSGPLAHLQELTILPGGSVEEPGWGAPAPPRRSGRLRGAVEPPARRRLPQARGAAPRAPARGPARDRGPRAAEPARPRPRRARGSSDRRRGHVDAAVMRFARARVSRGHGSSSSPGWRSPSRSSGSCGVTRTGPSPPTRHSHPRSPRAATRSGVGRPPDAGRASP